MADGNPPQPDPRPMFPPGVDPSIKPGPRPMPPPPTIITDPPSAFGLPDPRPIPGPTVDPPPGIVDPPGAPKGQGKQLIDAWIDKNGLNQYGDPQDTVYAGGNPLFDEATGKTISVYQYIRQNHPDKPWRDPLPTEPVPQGPVIESPPVAADPRGNLNPNGPPPTFITRAFDYIVTKLPDGMSFKDFRAKIEAAGGSVMVYEQQSHPPQQVIQVTFTGLEGAGIEDAGVGFEKILSDLGLAFNPVPTTSTDNPGNLAVRNDGTIIPIATTAGSSGVSPGSPGTGYPGEPESKGKIDVKIPPDWTGEPPRADILPPGGTLVGKPIVDVPGGPTTLDDPFDKSGGPITPLSPTVVTPGVTPPGPGLPGSDGGFGGLTDPIGGKHRNKLGYGGDDTNPFGAFGDPTSRPGPGI